MARNRKGTRRHARVNPRGVLTVRGGGFGFVQTAEGEFFIPESKMNGAFDGDLVEVAQLPTHNGRKARLGDATYECRGSSESPAARVLRVLNRAHDSLVGRCEIAEPFCVVVPEDSRIPYDIFTMKADYPDIVEGSLVRVRITNFPSRNSAATGVIEEVLGFSDDECPSVDLVIARHKLETSFSQAALDQARLASLDEQDALNNGYRDLRKRFIFTIDPDDARDFDDAISLDAVLGIQDGMGLHAVEGRSCSEARWRLGVHIADVSHYVPWNSSVDLDAKRRATSVYLVDRVIPMLPEELSGDLCSLRPDEVRRSMTVDMYLDKDAGLVAYDFYPALICSNKRLTYGQAQDIIDNQLESGEGCVFEDDSQDDSLVLQSRLMQLLRIAQKRIRRRERLGGLDFDSVEARVKLDAEGRPLSIDLRSKTDATSCVEEAMIFTNETVALHLHEAEFPNLYRVHEHPLADSLADLIPVFGEFAWFDSIDQARFIAGDSHCIQEVLKLSEGRAEADLVSSLVLRSMKRAVYSPDCMPHYGLASSAYSHFTSPIRRYPDLVVHRMLKAQSGGRSEKFDQEVAALTWIAEHSSAMERVAEKASRESQEIKIIEYLSGYIGQEFSAVISGVASYGLFVRLENTAEGIISLASLGSEYYIFDTTLYRLTGQDSGVSYRLGQRLAVVLTVADCQARRLEFRPVH